MGSGVSVSDHSYLTTGNSDVYCAGLLGLGGQTQFAFYDETPGQGLFTCRNSRTGELGTDNIGIQCAEGYMLWIGLREDSQTHVKTPIARCLEHQSTFMSAEQLEIKDYPYQNSGCVSFTKDLDRQVPAEYNGAIGWTTYTGLKKFYVPLEHDVTMTNWQHNFLNAAFQPVTHVALIEWPLEHDGGYKLSAFGYCVGNYEKPNDGITAFIALVKIPPLPVLGHIH